MKSLVFRGAHLTGDPASYYLSAEASTHADYDRLKALLGLDRPLPVQYVQFLANAIQGDLGKSIYMTANLGWLGAILGGAMFGFGMTLTGGCGNKTLVRLSQVLAVAVEYDDIPLDANPASGRRRRLKGTRPKRPWVEPQQLPSLLEAADGYLTKLGRPLVAAHRGAVPADAPQELAARRPLDRRPRVRPRVPRVRARALRALGPRQHATSLRSHRRDGRR